jgi:hypothetical protein
MKKWLIIPLILVALADSIFAQIPNNGFENWTSMGSYYLPDGWGNLNPVTNPAGIYTCIKGTPGNPGNSYIKLVSQTVTGMGVVPGIAVSGVLNTTTLLPESGFAYADRPTSLQGNWQFMASGTDQGFIAVFLTKWNTLLNRRDTIAGASSPLHGMVMSWQSFELLSS